MLKKSAIVLGLFLGGFSTSFAINSLFWTNGTGFPSVNGPWLGDSFYNINSLFTATARDAGGGYAPALSVSQTATQLACTQLPNDAFIEIKGSLGTGSVCLPQAIAGKRTTIANATTQTIDIFGTNTPFTVGTNDTINGVAGSSAYTGLSSGKNAVCFAANNGAWYCISGS